MEEQPPGKWARPRISREFVEGHRRRRYVEAAAELLHEFGRDGPTVTNLVRLAGTARNSFYDVFGGAEECIAHGVGLAAGEMFATLDGLGGEGDWLAEVGLAVGGFYGAVAERPLWGELLLIHSAASRPSTGEDPLADSIDRLAALLGRGRAESQARGLRPPPPLLDEYLAWAITAPAAAAVRGPEVAALPQKAAGVTVLVGGYYIGPAAAQQGPGDGAVRRGSS